MYSKIEDIKYHNNNFLVHTGYNVDDCKLKCTLLVSLIINDVNILYLYYCLHYFNIYVYSNINIYL